MAVRTSVSQLGDRRAGGGGQPIGHAQGGGSRERLGGPGPGHQAQQSRRRVVGDAAVRGQHRRMLPGHMQFQPLIGPVGGSGAEIEHRRVLVAVVAAAVGVHAVLVQQQRAQPRELDGVGIGDLERQMRFVARGALGGRDPRPRLAGRTHQREDLE
ncbi:hypothetical protein [Nocardia tengchongensis]|uniref:hypothetical protein n=1 Tax=Nocardia tengchongensis TaxID=2055889 RepID=UPI0036C4D322